ncbi:Protein of unknown function [Bacillus wiedmannii]|uniref:DUF2441 domain-containing protein n=1 Tax=Bacillus wiedmannii TaxID=1890302 RepID=A0A1G6JR15_9BACI|nr:DUF2441 domain-containing protein [Bacillus wiedmannii]SDC21133.1 Protein of unknown function [Bacillus wiedmannii]
MGSFYHVSTIKLAKGDILEPRYGLTLCDYKHFRSDQNKYSQYLKEQIFEDVRKDKFPSLPSRINSVYVWDDLESAISYIERNRYTEAFIYEVELENPKLAVRYDMSWLDLSNLQYYVIVKEIANHYYSGKSVSDNSLDWGVYEGQGIKLESVWETLYKGKVTIKHLVTSQ